MKNFILKNLKPPQVIVSVDDSVSAASLRKIIKLHADMLEVRIDRLKTPDLKTVLHCLRFFKRSGLPVIATVRSLKEGGIAALDSATRFELYTEALEVADMIDIELSSEDILDKVIRHAHLKGKPVIISTHDFKATPPDKTLKNILHNSIKHGADIVKIATTPQSVSDTQRLLEFTIQNRKKTIAVIAMGDLGAISRVLFPLAGSLLTYSFLSKSSAPGQIPLKKMSELIKMFFPKTEHGKQ